MNASDRTVPPAGPLHERPTGFVPRETVEAMLSGALDGVELGAYDRRITRWLSGFNTEAVAVASLIRRAWAEGVRTGRVEACDETAAGRAESRLTDLADARVGSDRWWGYEALPAWWDGTGDAETRVQPGNWMGRGLSSCAVARTVTMAGIWPLTRTSGRAIRP